MNTPLIYFQLFQLLVIALLAFPTAYILVFALGGLFYRKKYYPSTPSIKRFAVLIPGYKEDEVIVEVAKDALNQNYPSTHFDVIVIADSFQADTLEHLKLLPIKVIEVQFEKSTKSKALNQAFAVLNEPYDIALILDADNLMEPDFLTKMNAAFEADVTAVQGHRTAKNVNTPLAVLDAISEEINNHIFRKGHRALGLSSAIIGSGMAFRYDYFKNLMSTVQAIGGFDKEIELKMLKEDKTIEYLDDALVFDEKVQKAEVFSNQRRRWLSAQLHYFQTDILPATKDLLLRGNINYFDKAMQFIQPPRILLLGSVLGFAGVFLGTNALLGGIPTVSLLWIILVICCLLAFLCSIPKQHWNLQTLKALGALPKGMLLMLGSLLRIKGANKQFIHTKHSSNL